MNRFYIIIPFVLLAAFSGVYWRHSKETARLAWQKAGIVAQEKAAEEAKKAEAERQSREDAARREAARQAEEQKKEAEKRARWEADSARIAADTTLYTSQAKEAAQKISVLEKQLADIRSSKKTLQDEAFAAAHDAELLDIQKRNTEFEIQRLNEILVRKVANTSLATPP